MALLLNEKSLDQELVSVFEQKKFSFVNKNVETVIVASSIVATGGLILTQPANAQDSDPLTDLQSTLTQVGTIASSAVAIVLVALGIRLGIKQVNRIMTKG